MPRPTLIILTSLLLLTPILTQAQTTSRTPTQQQIRDEFSRENYEQGKSISIIIFKPAARFLTSAKNYISNIICDIRALLATKYEHLACEPLPSAQ